jgi:hypothetical protein
MVKFRLCVLQHNKKEIFVLWEYNIHSGSTQILDAHIQLTLTMQKTASFNLLFRQLKVVRFFSINTINWIW